MVTGITLVLLAIITRLLSPTYQIWNFVPVGAIALYAGARLPRRWAWAVPMVAMILSDIVLEYVHPWPYPELTRWTVYLTLAATTWLGLIAKRPKTPLWVLPILSLGASTLFFVTTNLATWAEGQLYPLTAAGLVACYASALEFHFLRNTVLADLLGTALLFGLGPIFERVGARWLELGPIHRSSSWMRPRPMQALEPSENPRVAKLLVSVRSAIEAEAALAGGASIIDVKEPSRGPLGRADWSVWREVRLAVPASIPVSVALGELTEWLEPSRLEIPEDLWAGIAFRKIGLSDAGTGWIDRWRDLRERPAAMRVEPTGRALDTSVLGRRGLPRLGEGPGS